MTTRMSELLTAAADRAVPVVQGIDDKQLNEPTPCADFTVRDLVNHLYQVVVNFQALAARESADFATTPDVTGGAWRDGFEQESRRLIEAWSDPASLEGVSAGMGLPQETVGTMALLDLTVHAWDLAQATGQAFTPDADAVAALHALVEQMAPTARKMGVFAEPVEAAPDADSFERLLAATGRKPDAGS